MKAPRRKGRGLTAGRLIAGAALALTSVWVMAQDAPESLLPPGFDRPAAPEPAPPSARAAPQAERPSPGSGAASSVSTPVVQSVGTASETASEDGADSASADTRKLPSLDELARMTPEELEDTLGLKPRADIPPAARRSMRQVGILAVDEGGMPPGLLARQDAGLVNALLARNSGRMVSRWGHILLRRALVSRLDAPQGMNPADFAALRAGLLLRMGEGEAARAVVQDVDTANYSPLLSNAAFDAYVETADYTGMCPMLLIVGNTEKDPRRDAASAICAAFRGEGAAALSRLDRQLGQSAMPRIDLLLAQKYAGAAGKSRRAVTIEWDNVNDLTPWRYTLALAVGLTPPDKLLNGAGIRYDSITAVAPMAGLTARARAAEHAAGAGILSSAAMVDLYSQIHADPDTAAGDWADRAKALRDAYVAAETQARMTAIRKLWDTGAADARYSRMVLTAYAAARMPVSEALADDSGELIASMLTAGLDRNAARWANVAEQGSLGWALLALAAPGGGEAGSGPVSAFHSDDGSADARKSAFLVAGLAGLGRLSPSAAKDLAGDIGIDLNRQTKWTRMIDKAAEVRNPALVALLAGAGMQGDGWQRMTALHLFHIVSALRKVGLEAEARMIAAEAVARG
ncbi:MAG: hypothetical protein M0R03_10865 [Novosphingobium sp.]|nr:hypothetical protein [Novosphingobium sp.]